jgi:hypothetical protein
MTALKDKPILFSGEMVRALLNTQPNVWPPEPIDPSKPFKAVTRRVVKLREPFLNHTSWKCVYPNPKGGWTFTDKPWSKRALNSVHELTKGGKMPPYQPGQRLWVKEAAVLKMDGGIGWPVYQADGAWIVAPPPYLETRVDPRYYPCLRKGKSYCPPMFMKREHARLFLEVKSVRPERVRDMKECDYQLEGGPAKEAFVDPYMWWVSLWDSLNSDRGHGWHANPWVWRIEFMRVTA